MSTQRADTPSTAPKGLESLRLRLYDVASELRPLTTPDELENRLRRVAAELHSISHDLALLAHIEEIEDGGLEDELRAIDEQLANGWVPEGRSADALVTDLRREFA